MKWKNLKVEKNPQPPVEDGRIGESMKVLSFGSLNMDYVYTLDHIVVPGETESSTIRNVFTGGKGLNQSIAMARAGLAVHHAGLVGEEGTPLIEALEEAGVDASLVKILDAPTGHTFIQVNKEGQNSIVLFGGTNQMVTEEYIDEALAGFGKGDLILLQNEINMLDVIIDKAYAKGMIVALNPSPFDRKILACDLGKVSLFFVNEVEGSQISGESANEPEKILDWFDANLAGANIVLTLGTQGAWYRNLDGARTWQPAVKTEAVDTTAAGDTFTGYFLQGWIQAMPISACMARAAKAAAIAVSREGAAPSIPTRDEVE